MAGGARVRSGADVAVAVTGIAGPGGSGVKPEGRVCFGLATAAGIGTGTVEFGARGRDAVRRAARDHALKLVLAALAPSP
jgi:nicotinamide-nucleotide amidase